MTQLVLKAFTLGPLAANCYVVYDAKSLEAVVIDPGMECEPLLCFVESYSLQVTNILLTHGHFDHIGGVSELKASTRAAVWIHAFEREWLTDPTANGSALWLDEPIIAPEADHLLQGGESLTLLGVPVDVLFTPGHSPGHVSFRWPDYVMSGDALFQGSIGRTDLPGGDHRTLIASIERELLTLPDDTLLLPGHGGSTTVGNERRWNPFLVGR